MIRSAHIVLKWKQKVNQNKSAGDPEKYYILERLAAAKQLNYTTQLWNYHRLEVIFSYNHAITLTNSLVVCGMVLENSLLLYLIWRWRALLIILVRITNFTFYSKKCNPMGKASTLYNREYIILKRCKQLDKSLNSSIFPTGQCSNQCDKQEYSKFIF